MPIKGVIVAAGYGTRFLPITKCIPKEMLPLVDRPAIDFIVEEFVAAGIEDVLVISSRRKKSLEDWFDREVELEERFIAEEATEKLAQIKPPRIRTHFVRQQQMRGTGDALLLARSFAGQDPVVVAFPDDIFPLSDGAPGCTEQLIAVHQKTGTSVIATADYSGRDVSPYGVLDVEERSSGLLVNAIVEKPAPGEEPSSWISLGRYLYTPELFARLEEGLSRHGEGEFYPMDALNGMASEGKLFAVDYSGPRWDTGNVEGYLEAVLDEAMRRPELARVLRDWASKRLG
jgi:UTP--glucose-1-phosphate uridylyltransferase